MQEGKKIWVESLLTTEEWKKCFQKFKGTTANIPEPIPEFECEFKWRKGMGSSLKNEEIENINKNLEYLRKKVNK